MRILLENPSHGKSVNAEVSDDFFDHAEEEVFIITPNDRYKLVSTKSPEDKRREELAGEFSAEEFPVIYDNHITDPEAIAKHISTRLDDDKYQELLKLGNRELLEKSLCTAYNQYSIMQKKYDDILHDIDEHKMDDNVFFDYAAQAIYAINHSSSLKEFNEAIQRINRNSRMDPRGMVGSRTISNAMLPLLNRIEELLEEIKKNNPSDDPLTSRDFYASTEWWDVSVPRKIREMAMVSLAKLTDSYHDTAKSLPEKGPRFEYYLTKMHSCYERLNVIMGEFLAKEHKDDDAVAIEQARVKLTGAWNAFFNQMDELRIQHCIDPRKDNSDSQHLFIDRQFDLYDARIDAIDQQRKKGETFNPIQFYHESKAIESLLQALLDHKVELEKIVNHEYTEEELGRLISS